MKSSKIETNFKNYIKFQLDKINENLNTMEMGIDLTKVRSDEYVKQKTKEYLDESK